MRTLSLIHIHGGVVFVVAAYAAMAVATTGGCEGVMVRRGKQGMTTREGVNGTALIEPILFPHSVQLLSTPLFYPTGIFLELE